MNKSRIQLNDSYQDIVMKMAEGNPGAMRVLIEMIQPNFIDLDSLMGGMEHILLLDRFGIYGWRIYVLHQDICGGVLAKTMACLRAAQLGIINPNVLKDACNRQDRSGREMVDPDRLYFDVKKRFPGFDREETAGLKED